MNAQTPALAAEKPLGLSPAIQADIPRAAEKARTVSPPAKLDLDIHNNAEAIRSSILRMTSNSIEEVESLMSELQEVREFLRTEGDRVQREILNYAQLNQSALAAIKIITDTISPWKTTALDGETQSSGVETLFDEMEKRGIKAGAPNE
jgi:hypothetical protein